jgi:hypothetical protein
MGLSPASVQAQDVSGCWYCNFLTWVQRFECENVLQGLDGGLCPPQGYAGNLGCARCTAEEQEQEEEVAVDVQPDGTLSAPGTVFDGVDQAWLHLIADRGEGLSYTVWRRCQPTLLLRVADAGTDP